MGVGAEEDGEVSAKELEGKVQKIKTDTLTDFKKIVTPLPKVVMADSEIPFKTKVYPSLFFDGNQSSQKITPYIGWRIFRVFGIRRFY